MHAVHIPYASARLLSLFLSFVFGIVSFALVLNANAKANAQEAEIEQRIPNGITLTIDTSDITSAATAVAVFALVLALVSLAKLSFLVLALFSKPSARSWKITRLCAWLAMRALLAQGIFLLVLTVGLLGAAAAMTDFFATREAAVSATALGFPVPEVIIRDVEEALHISPVYRDIDYCEFINRLLKFGIGRLSWLPCLLTPSADHLPTNFFSSSCAVRLAVIFPWIAFFFGATSSALSLATWRYARQIPPAPPAKGDASPASASRIVVNEKHGKDDL